MDNKEVKMGTVRNEMTIVHHWKREELEKVRNEIDVPLFESQKESEE